MLDMEACIAEVTAVLRRHNCRGSDAEDAKYIAELRRHLSQGLAIAD